MARVPARMWLGLAYFRARTPCTSGTRPQRIRASAHPIHSASHTAHRTPHARTHARTLSHTHTPHARAHPHTRTHAAHPRAHTRAIAVLSALQPRSWPHRRLRYSFGRHFSHRCLRGRRLAGRRSSAEACVRGDVHLWRPQQRRCGHRRLPRQRCNVRCTVDGLRTPRPTGCRQRLARGAPRRCA